MTDETKVSMTVRYFKGTGVARTFSHSYDETWLLSDLHCPGCGKAKCVWHQDGAGDYYVGVTHICTACRSRFYLPVGVMPIGADEIDQQRLKGLLGK